MKKTTIEKLSLLGNVAVAVVAVFGFGLGIFNTYQAHFSTDHRVWAHVFDAENCPDTSTPRTGPTIGCVQLTNLGNRHAIVTVSLQPQPEADAVPISFRGFRAADLVPGGQHTFRIELGESERKLTDGGYDLTLRNLALAESEQKREIRVENGLFSPGTSRMYCVRSGGDRRESETTDCPPE